MDLLNKRQRMIAKQYVGPVIVVLAWAIAAALIATSLGTAGCAYTAGTQPAQVMTTADLLDKTGENLAAINDTLATLADAGIVSRDSDDYQTAKAALLEARDMLRYAWQAYFRGATSEAEDWRLQVVAAYSAVRPKLEAMQNQGVR
ncbi:MAG: hypothetical protein KDJ39_05905 [Gammaproteobacteria bacterium]|nr:hypothetical protein [Gammaproteobacteria bacterium]